MKTLKLSRSLSVISFFLLITALTSGCSKKKSETPPPVIQPEVKEAVYDETGCLFTSYKNLVMAGYQGWFAAQGDASNRGWYHYQRANKFEPG